MNVTIKSNFLTVPVNMRGNGRKLLFYKNVDGEKKLVFDLDVMLDPVSPDFTGFVDVRRFMGETLEIVAEPELDFPVGEADKLDFPDLYREEMRPMSHFSVKNGWNNDPNGLVQLNGTYHMFYQYNPMAPSWGNMHWGHAVSNDLLHWEEKDIALFPDEMGTMYSGSGIFDERNLTGLGTAENPPLLLFYTAAGERNRLSVGKGRVQCIAYSVDNGETFEKYSGNPVVPSMAHYNRDPKVVFVPELGCYVMALFMIGDKYALLRSENLLDWSMIQEIDMEGENECPDFFGFVLGGVNYWVLIGAHDKYVVGCFENGKFVQKTGLISIGTGKDNINYAAQSFSGIDDGRVVRLHWQRIRVPDNRFLGQMGIPEEYELKLINGEPRLTLRPVREISELYADTFVKSGEIGENFEFGLVRAAYDIEISADVSKEYKLSIFGSDMTLSREDNSVIFNGETVCPLPEGETELRVIVDRCSFEIYVNGLYFNVKYAVCDYEKSKLEINGRDFCVKKIKINELANIH